MGLTALHLMEMVSQVGKVPSSCLDVTEKGLSKIKENFKSKLFESFPDLRYQILFGDLA